MHALPVLALGWSLGVTHAAAPAGAANPASPVGRWVTGADGGVVAIHRCGDARFCGRIVGIPRAQPNAPMPVDSEGRPECGLTIITNAVKSGDGEWSGKILDPRNGVTYSAKLWLDTAGRLHVRGYLGLSVFGETVVWQPFRGQIGDDCRIAGAATR